MNLIVTDQAKKDLGRLDKPMQKRIIQALDLLISRPKAADLKKLQGHQDLWRLRVGDFRIVLQIISREVSDDELKNRKEITVYALRVMHRREVYRQL